uniref:Uncharacterized protein n=1 Tax=Pyxicephalus adspersus TaxID=30357 RepID=A0AAV3APK3_PYXAD|nr:TPA: hypothetical protein GDO54_008822 [Pyxicephalus adspersus]
MKNLIYILVLQQTAKPCILEGCCQADTKYIAYLVNVKEYNVKYHYCRNAKRVFQKEVLLGKRPVKLSYSVLMFWRSATFRAICKIKLVVEIKTDGSDKCGQLYIKTAKRLSSSSNKCHCRQTSF